MKNLPYLSKDAIREFINRALEEDVGPGDYSSLGALRKGQFGQAKLLIKEPGIIAGLELAKMIFEQYDAELKVNLLLNDGDAVQAGDLGLTVEGSAVSILSTERLVLNCMQRMSGIATKTNRLNQMIAHTKAKLMDTRKTTPNFRIMEKWAVVLGGGLNHRFALYDMVMLKDNHVDFAGGISNAINNTRAFLKANQLNLKIEIETRNLEEVEQALATGGADFIMLDNMDYNMMREAVKIVDGRVPLEASGGITEDTLKDVAECGVDFISVGALTHQVKSMDISLKAY
ncbi:Quinolinate phosphoribosyltransferase [Indibacter alkaliphilus LW1]|uniref:Probable nicotinate-nucleotide pyrophosphorylase [carboxylating] n=1 Tax=Indibacter alkaliphilus (strain CCUG 57479 / KCTC 22604 / LW1) TaxID=1189612 RepID=S2D541_INDAL|nr:carboxylating nicotinate-nucleotide diphosphorylase [Indibacter alkaliphilus]EOZ92175.1 Quinolinate phosphoribosyltransferase [Indibacter alkaliphilus LW1]